MDIKNILLEFILFLVLISIILTIAYTQLPSIFNSTAHPTLIMNGTDYQSWINMLPMVVVAILVLVVIVAGFALLKTHKRF